MEDRFDATHEMEKYKTTDWKFEFSSLPRWNNRDRIPFVYDKFYPIPQSDALCCIYSIAEASMGWYVGFLALLQNKEKPELVLNLSDIAFLDKFWVNKNGNIVFLQTEIYNSETNQRLYPVLILNIIEKKFTYYITDEYNLSFNITEQCDHVFEFEADKRFNAQYGDIIDLHALQWFDWGEIVTLPQKVWHDWDEITTLPLKKVTKKANIFLFFAALCLLIGSGINLANSFTRIPLVLTICAIPLLLASIILHGIYFTKLIKDKSNEKNNKNK